jgi:metallophosphoesterase (TIGR00282 family)
MRILFVGDIVGRPGRRAVQTVVPRLRREREVDVVVANAENSAGGHGATPEVLTELAAAGVDAYTMGNHTWRKKVLFPLLDQMNNIVRPANYPEGTPGRGGAVITLADGRKLGIVNLMGRVYMEPLECPFREADRQLEALHAETKVVLVDMHAEATSEKVAMGWHLDGRASAVVGTHTHVQTADEQVLPGGTAYITDVGMCGPWESVIGSEIGPVLTRFRTALPQTFNVAKGAPHFCGVLIDVNDETGKAVAIERLYERLT